MKLKSRSDIHQILAITEIDPNRDAGFLTQIVQQKNSSSIPS